MVQSEPIFHARKSMNRRFKELEARGTELGPHTTTTEFNQCVERIRTAVPQLLDESASHGLIKIKKSWGKHNLESFEGFESSPIKSETGASVGSIFIGAHLTDTSRLLISYRIVNAWNSTELEHKGYQFSANSIMSVDYKTDGVCFVYQDYQGLTEVKMLESILTDFRKALLPPQGKE